MTEDEFLAQKEVAAEHIRALPQIPGGYSILIRERYQDEESSLTLGVEKFVVTHGQLITFGVTGICLAIGLIVLVRKLSSRAPVRYSKVTCQKEEDEE